MAKTLHPQQFLHILHCPCSAEASLSWNGSDVVCQRCARLFPVRHDILDLVDEPSLDSETRRELRGNTVSLDDQSIEYNASKDERSGQYYTYLSEKKMACLLRYLDRISCSALISLGSGTGYEIKCLSKRLPLETVYASDLSFTILYVARYTLQDVDIDFGRFTSDLQHCPVKSSDIPILIYEALHHTNDLHATLEDLLKARHSNLFLVEPTENVFIRWLARWGLAQRVEYSGLKPTRLRLGTLRSLCRRYGYRARITTQWVIPDDYFRLMCRNSRVLEQTVLFLVELLSGVGNVVKFGNVAIVRLEKVGQGDGRTGSGAGSVEPIEGG
jgi:hypothetical protein